MNAEEKIAASRNETNRPHTAKRAIADALVHWIVANMYFVRFKTTVIVYFGCDEKPRYLIPY